MSCRLCDGERVTRRHHECPVCWIADCDRCRTPMVVWKTHGVQPPEGEVEHMMAALREVAGECRLDTARRSIPDHWHAHAR